MNDLSVYTEGDEVKPNNPFAERRKKQHTLLEIALEVLQTITCRKGPSTFIDEILKWMPFSLLSLHGIDH